MQYCVKDNTHIFFFDPVIKNNLSGHHVADQQTLRYSGKEESGSLA